MEFIINPDGTPAPTQDLPATGDVSPTTAIVIKESSTATFAVDVIEASAETPIIVDFWAPWCEPCKTLGPMLEKAVRHTGGLVHMVKINIDENQDLAAQLRIQSIPTVYAFKDGRPIDGFTGAVPESQIKSFVDRLLAGSKPPIEEAMEQGDAAMAAGDAETAYAIYCEVVAQEPDNGRALAGMIRSALARGETQEAKELIESLTPEMLQNSDVAQAISAVELAEQGSGADSIDTSALRARLVADPKDHEARYDLAVALFAASQAETAIDELVTLVRHNRTWNEEAARKQLVKIFDALGFSDPVAQEGRRKLSSVLFS